MANEKKLQKAATKFRKENPEKHSFYSIMINLMADFIKGSGAAEVTVGFKGGEFYAHANN